MLSFVDKHIKYVDELIVVDDGSTQENIISKYIKPSKKLRLFRVTKDYGFNSHGCRNLIMKKSNNDFVVLMDSDREFLYAEEAFKAIKSKKLKKNILYRFIGHTSKGDVHISVNDYLIHKEHFFSVGGYDEEWIGFRNGDRQFFKQLEHFGKEKILLDIDIKMTREATLRVKNAGNILSKKDKSFLTSEEYDKVINRIKTPEPNKKILTFDWEEIA